MVKAEVCKTSMRRFESARRLQFTSSLQSLLPLHLNPFLSVVTPLSHASLTVFPGAPVRIIGTTPNLELKMRKQLRTAGYAYPE